MSINVQVHYTTPISCAFSEGEGETVTGAYFEATGPVRMAWWNDSHDE